MARRIVQTILEESEYEEFRRASKRVRKTLREAAREAIRKWAEETSGVSAEDPLFRIRSVSYGDPKASEYHDRLLYGAEL